MLYCRLIYITLERDNPLSEFKQCGGNFPNTITLYCYSSNPCTENNIKINDSESSLIKIEKEVKVTDACTNEQDDIWINWINDAIDKKTIKYFNYEDFSNFQEIGKGAFGKVFRVNLRNSGQHFALMSFFNFNDTLKEIVREVMLA
jgi:hypothetical protein